MKFPATMLKQAVILYALCLVPLYLCVLYGSGFIRAGAMMSGLLSESTGKGWARIGLVLLLLFPLAIVLCAVLAFYAVAWARHISGPETTRAALLFGAALIITLFVNIVLSRLSVYHLPALSFRTSVQMVRVTLNPEIGREQRDFIRRSSDFLDIKMAIDLLLKADPDAYLGEPRTVYVSLPDSSPTCANLSLPSLPRGWTYHCVSQENLQKNDGTGWLPVNINYVPGNLYFSYWQLYKYRIDPINDASSGLYYRYTVSRDGRWELRAKFESGKYPPEDAVYGNRRE
jgi:uncharacterized membrane protein